MRSVRTIFIKQMSDMFRNPAVLVQMIIFPAVAFAMTVLIARTNDDIPNTMFVSMMGAIFVGMAMVISTASIIAEDIEHKSLRFLVIAGVKPHQYLLGIGGFLLAAASITSGLFAAIGGFAGRELFNFLAIMISGAASSIVLGAAIGLLSKNQQAATATGMPVSMVIGFLPMITPFNATAERIASVLYTQQINIVAATPSMSIGQPMLVICANIAVLTAFFIYAYRRMDVSRTNSVKQLDKRAARG